MSDSSAVELISSQEIFKVPSSSTKTIKSAEQDECEDTKLRECGSNGNTKFMENNGTERDSAISGMSIVTPVLNYVQPPWACTPKKGMGYKLEIVKNGTIVDDFDMDKRRNDSFMVIGRLPNCDVVLDHPSISRYHCVLQYGEDLIDRSGKGWHLFDMGSTHGSRANKKKLPAKQYVRARVGFVLQFGGSSRLISIVGPDSDREPEWDCSPTEMMEIQKKKDLEANLNTVSKRLTSSEKETYALEEINREKGQESDGISWGLDYEETDDEPITTVEMDPHLMEDREAYYNTDPKKALAKFFEREGFDMKFDFSEQGSAHNHKWLCSIELPIEISGVDRMYTAQATVSTSKKDAQFQCALEACRVLDSYGILRRANMKIRAKGKILDNNDFYEEDDDIYLDRTGQIEQQREKRRLWAQSQRGTNVIVKDTYESLCVKRDETREMIVEVQTQLDKLQRKNSVADGGSDSLDEYCRQLSQEICIAEDMKIKIQKSMLRQKLVGLTHDAQHLEKLIKIAKPVPLPEIRMGNSGIPIVDVNKNAFLRKLMMVGRKSAIGTDNKFCKDSIKENNGKPKFEEVDFHPDEEEPSSVYAEVPTKSRNDEIDKGILKKENERSTVNHIVLHEETESTNKNNEQPSLMELKQNDDSTNAPKKKRMRIRHRNVKQSGDEYGASCDSRDDQYATWLPPEDQSGDGKTKLHEKFIGRY